MYISSVGASRVRVGFGLVMGFTAVCFLGSYSISMLSIVVQIKAIWEFFTVFFKKDIVSLNKQKDMLPEQTHHFFNELKAFYWINVLIFNLLCISFLPIPHSMMLLSFFGANIIGVFNLLFFIGISDKCSTDLLILRYKYFAISLSTLIMVMSSWLFIRLTLICSFWSIITMCCLAVNDISAYYIGSCIGKWHIVTLSPNKTFEGYIGALIPTCAFSLVFTYVAWPIHSFFAPGPFCEINTSDCTSLFQTSTPHLHILVHVFVMACIISIFCPFCGLVLSGLKRALSVKDYCSCLGKHGGVIDRLDCSPLMVALVYVYVVYFIPIVTNLFL